MKSSSFKGSKTFQFIKYGEGYIEGEICKDKMSLEKGVTGSDFQFLNVFYAEDFLTLKSDGIIGLSAAPIGSNIHTLFVPYLYYSNQIPFNIFQLDLANKDNPKE